MIQQLESFGVSVLMNTRCYWHGLLGLFVSARCMWYNSPSGILLRRVRLGFWVAFYKEVSSNFVFLGHLFGPSLYEILLIIKIFWSNIYNAMNYKIHCLKCINAHISSCTHTTIFIRLSIDAPNNHPFSRDSIIRIHLFAAAYFQDVKRGLRKSK